MTPPPTTTYQHGALQNPNEGLIARVKVVDWKLKCYSHLTILSRLTSLWNTRTHHAYSFVANLLRRLSKIWEGVGCTREGVGCTREGVGCTREGGGGCTREGVGCTRVGVECTREGVGCNISNCPNILRNAHFIRDKEQYSQAKNLVRVCENTR